MNRARVFIVAESPGPAGSQRPLDGPSGKRIATLLGISFTDLAERAELRNLLLDYPGAAWPEGAGRAAALDVMREAESRDVLILLGQNVARSFGLCGRGMFPLLMWSDRVVESRSLTFGVIPAPSGRSTWWTERDKRAEVRSFLAPLLSTEEDAEPRLFAVGR